MVKRKRTESEKMTASDPGAGAAGGGGASQGRSEVRVGSGEGRAYLRSGLSPSLRCTQQQAVHVPFSEAASPFSPGHPPPFCLLLLLQKHSLSGLISSICCNRERIQITTFPCADHMFVPHTEVALSLNQHTGSEGENQEVERGGRALKGARSPGAWVRAGPRASGLRGARGFRPGVSPPCGASLAAPF